MLTASRAPSGNASQQNTNHSATPVRLVTLSIGVGAERHDVWS
jgi:hypothetical protein